MSTNRKRIVYFNRPFPKRAVLDHLVYKANADDIKEMGKFDYLIEEESIFRHSERFNGNKPDQVDSKWQNTEVGGTCNPLFGDTHEFTYTQRQPEHDDNMQSVLKNLTRYVLARLKLVDDKYATRDLKDGSLPLALIQSTLPVR